MSRDGSLEFILWVTKIHQSVSTRNVTWPGRDRRGFPDSMEVGRGEDWAL